MLLHLNSRRYSLTILGDNGVHLCHMAQSTEVGSGWQRLLASTAWQVKLPLGGSLEIQIIRGNHEY